MRRTFNLVLYPWFLASYMILYLYAVNIANIRQGDVLEVMAAALATTIVIYAGCYVLTHDTHKSGALTSVIALVFLSYGHIFNTLNDSKLGQTLLMPAMLVLAVLAMIAIVRSATFWRKLAPYLNVILVGLLVMPVFQIVEFTFGKPGIGATARANSLEQVLVSPVVSNSAEYPDIYYIILDGYSSNRFWEREYGYDNSAFTDALTARGFYVAQDSLSNYPVTIVSLPSSLNMRYITDDDKVAARQNEIPDRVYLRSLIANNRVAYELKQSGYSYLYILSGYLAPSTLADVNIAFYPEGTRYFSGNDFQLDGHNGTWAYEQPFWPFFIETTLIRSLASRFVYEEPGQPLPRYSPKIVLRTFDELERIVGMDEATFTFAHILKPHFPLQFDRYGNVIDINLSDSDPEKPKYFFEELYFLNTRVIELVDYLLAKSSIPPIIVIQADHGTRLGNPETETRDWRFFEILNALYLPGGHTDDLHRSIAPINTFRRIFNDYFDGDYELLESSQYILPYGWSDFFTYEQYFIDNRLNGQWGDQIALIYNATDVNGSPELHVYAVSDAGERGDFLFAISEEDLTPFIEDPPEQNTLFFQQGQIAFYVLTTGEFQFNLGPDAEGHEWAFIMDSFPPGKTYGYEVGSN